MSLKMTDSGYGFLLLHYLGERGLIKTRGDKRMFRRFNWK